ncbi:MAG: DUF4349 domain-containing protein [Acholeplasmataceae bacterium]|nr:MAG: DUF4349 domain-containing protein [Acholeplasmataceae bacterium]
MRKQFASVVLLLFGFLLFGCSTAMDPGDDFNDSDNDDQTILLSDDVPQRKIIYTVDSSFDVENLGQSITTLRSLLNSDEWFDQEVIGSNQAIFRARIKTERLDEFADALNTQFQVRSFSKEGRDISLQYQDKTNRITSIELQITRLQELYESASLSDMIVINQQMSALEVELMRLQGELSVFDSLIDYSEVTIRLYSRYVVTRSPFINRFANGFLDGFSAVGSLLDWIGIAIANLLPFAIVFGPIGYGVYFVRKKYFLPRKLKKKESLKPKE